MKMMYKLIAEALRDCGLTGQRHPRDYLNFYCLGNREVKKSFEPEPLRKPEPNSKHVRLIQILAFSFWFSGTFLIHSNI
jgi:phospholipase D1/2